MLEFRYLEKQDLQDRVRWMNDARVNCTMHIRLPIEYEKTLLWFDRISIDPSRRDFSLLQDGIPVAMTGLSGFDPEIRKVETYTFVNPEAMGNGYGTLSSILGCAYAFDTWGVHKVWAHVDATNERSLHMHLKMGFVQEGQLRDEVLRDGIYRDRLVLGLFKEELNQDLYNRLSAQVKQVF